MPSLNNTLWTLSLILQIALVLALFSRGIARRLPAFTVLVTFYPLRAILLFTLYGHLAAQNYASLYASFSLLDLLLQAAVATEIVLALVRKQGGWSLRHAILCLLLLAFAVGTTTVILAGLPPHMPIPVDRAQTAAGCLMLGLLVWTLISSTSPLLRRVTLGLGLYASISLFSQAARATAAAHRDVDAYTRWSYTTVAAWLIVVTLWLLTLKSSSATSAPLASTAPPPSD